VTTAVRFLSHLAQAISAITLYDRSHPTRLLAMDRAYEWLLELQDTVPTPTFTFMGDEVLLDSWPLREMRNWDWSARLAARGVQRVEFLDRVTRDDFHAFLLEIQARLSDEETSTAEVRQGRPSSIRYGEVQMKGEEEGEGEGPQSLPTVRLGYSLKEEIRGIQWLHGELQDEKALHLAEASGIVRSLSVAMHSDQTYMIPLLRLKEYDQYTTTPSLNVAVLTMALAEFLGLAPREVRTFGIAGLLHDLGKVKIPGDILNKPGALTDQEREVINSHTVEGARLIIETEQDLDVAAVVAYEHHMRIDGGGYPRMLYQRESHAASALVHVCDVFDALRTDRPYRRAMATKRALRIIEAGAGTDFDPDVAHAFVKMMRRWETRIAEVNPDDPEVEVLPGLVQHDEDDVYDLDEARLELIGVSLPEVETDSVEDGEPAVIDPRDGAEPLDDVYDLDDEGGDAAGRPEVDDMDDDDMAWIDVD
jgi:putative nucleotidyltransferase with HDIG domain